MEISSIIILKNLQYLILACIIVFAVLSLIFLNIKKQFIIFFLFYLFAGFFVLSLYFIELFFLLLVPSLLFLLFFYMFNLQGEIYSVENLGKESFYFDYGLETEADRKIKDKEDLGKKKKEKILSLVLPTIFCVSLVFLFGWFINPYKQSFELLHTAVLVGFSNLATEMFTNYSILIILILILLFTLTVWAISLFVIRKNKE